jgi:pristinamycin I synthase 3 and 4
MSKLSGERPRSVTIRGFSIDVEEIEAILRNHDEIQDALVMTCDDEVGEKQLVAYVIRRQTEQEYEQARASHIGVWQRIYDSAYRRKQPQVGDFNTATWNNSYTGEPIAAEEMRELVDETVARIRAFAPRRVLEIGCGTGLLLTRLAAGCESYLGTDFSAEVLKQLQGYLSTRPDLNHVVLREGLANDLAFMLDDSVDFVILNSVVQYFPDVDYFLKVLREAARVTSDGGHVFLGDIRSLPLLEAFHASLEMHRSDADEPIEALRHRMREGMNDEKELILDPVFFEELNHFLGKVGRVEISLKPGAYENENSRFRYDVMISIGKKMAVAGAAQWLVWDGQGRWKQQLKELLAVDTTLSIGVRAIPDKRAVSATAAVQMVRGTRQDIKLVGELRAACTVAQGEDPREVERVAKSLGVGVYLCRFEANGCYDAIYNPSWSDTRLEQGGSLDDLRRHAYTPCRPVTNEETADVQRLLRDRLPEHMVPWKIVSLDTWPLTASGILDPAALPLV